MRDLRRLGVFEVREGLNVRESGAHGLRLLGGREAFELSDEVSEEEVCASISFATSMADVAVDEPLERLLVVPVGARRVAWQVLEALGRVAGRSVKILKLDTWRITMVTLVHVRTEWADSYRCVGVEEGVRPFPAG